MPDFLIIALLVATLLAPLALSLLAAVVLDKPYSWVAMAFTWLVGITSHVGLAVYSASLHPEWWSEGNGWYIFVAFFLVDGMMGVLAIEGHIQKQRATRRSSPDNVRRLRRSA